MIGVVYDKKQSPSIPEEWEVSVRYADGVVVRDYLSSFVVI